MISFFPFLGLFILVVLGAVRTLGKHDLLVTDVSDFVRKGSFGNFLVFCSDVLESVYICVPDSKDAAGQHPSNQSDQHDEDAEDNLRDFRHKVDAKDIVGNLGSIPNGLTIGSNEQSIQLVCHYVVEGGY